LYCSIPGMKGSDIRETMLQKNYDVVPIYNKQRVFNIYFTLKKRTLLLFWQTKLVKSIGYDMYCLIYKRKIFL